MRLRAHGSPVLTITGNQLYIRPGLTFRNSAFSQTMYSIRTDDYFLVQHNRLALIVFSATQNLSSYNNFDKRPPSKDEFWLHNR